MATPTDSFEKQDDAVGLDDDKRKSDIETPEVLSIVGVPELTNTTTKEPAWTRRCKAWVDKVRSLKFLASLLQVESHGIEPIPKERRTDKRYYEFFFVWFSGSFNVLNFSTGSIGPAVFKLNLQEAIITLMVVDLITLLIPSFFGLFGPRHGMRAMVQSRYSLGYYGASLPSLLNAISLQGFLVINSIVGGQTLASVSKDLSWTVGIVIIGVIALFLSFCGYRVVHWYENVAWIPNVISFSIMLGVGAKNLVNDRSGPPSSIGAIISFASTVAATNISWTPMAADFGVFHSPDTSNWRVFIYAYLGYFLSSALMHSIGASFAASAPFVPRWSEGYNNGRSVGGLLHAVLSPLGVFGDILTVMIALTIPSACTLSMYSCCTSFMTVSSVFAKIPRNVYSIISTAILIPLAIVGSTRFYTTFVNLLSIVGYWSACFTAILVAEHIFFRKMRFDAYDPSQWASPRLLPPGIAGISAFLLPYAVIIPCMSQVWYVGPVAKKGTGDLGVFVGWGAAFVLYLGLRWLERRWLEKRKEGLKVEPRIERSDAKVVC